MNSNYKRIYTGNIFEVQQIQDALSKIDITPVVKDDSESGRLAGFGAPSPSIQEIFVHESEYEKAVSALENILKK